MKTNPLIWIIDEEWADYDAEKRIFEERYPDCEIRYSKNDYEGDLEEFGYRADAILAQVYVELPRKTIEKLECCKGIAVYGGGYDRVDIKAAKEKGIMVTNVQGYCAEDLADYVIAAMYHFNKKLTKYYSSIKNGLWGAQVVSNPVRRLQNSTLFILGFGRIGQTTAQRAALLGLNVIVYDPHNGKDRAKSMGFEYVDLDEGLKRADYVSVHIKLTEETRGIVTMRELKLMKPTAYLINTARGAIIKENDLINALNEHVIAGAVLDVITNEPPTDNEPIFDCENIVVTPHVSYISAESYGELKKRSSENAIKMMEGEKPADLVNE